MEQVSCPACHTSEPSLLFAGADLLHGEEGLFPVVRCSECGTVYLNPRPGKKEIAKFYPPDYMPHALARRSSRRWISRLDYRYGLTKRCRLLMRYRPPGRLLDVGCATGEFLVRARELGWEPHGVELSPHAARYARERWGLEVQVGELEDVPYPEGAFDAVTMWNVFEHLYAPLMSIDCMAGLLAPGGVVVMTIPHLGSLDRALFGRWWSGYDVPRHLHVFSLKALGSAFGERGFDVVDMRCLYGSYHAFFLSLQFYARGLGRPALQGLALSLSGSRALRLLSFPAFWALDRIRRGTILTVVFRKRTLTRAA